VRFSAQPRYISTNVPRFRWGYQMAFWKKDRSIDRELRQNRPEPSEEFVSQLADSARPTRTWTAPRPALAGLLTVVVFGALAISGGLSKAANQVQDTLGGGGAAAAPAAFTYTDCTISVGPQTGNGANRSRIITVTKTNGYTGAVTLSATFSAGGASGIGFSPNPVTTTSTSTLSYKITGSPNGTVTVTGTTSDGGCTGTGTYTS
jgi:hypothetical protein